MQPNEMKILLNEKEEKRELLFPRGFLLTNDGKIIACKTVSQKESKDFGDACAKPSFYTQFNGKTETDYNDIDAISGATITTNAYKNAILRAFETLKILKGEA